MANPVVGKRLKKAREAAGYSQVAVYKKTGINNKTLSGYENGVSDPDLESLNILANTYDVSVDYLTGRSEFPKPGESSERFYSYKGVVFDLEKLIEEGDIELDGAALSPELKKDLYNYVRYMIRARMALKKDTPD